MKIEIWSDIVCPFCYIGLKRLEEALEAYPEKDSVEIRFRSYLLAPHYRPEGETDVYAYMAKKNGLTVEEARTRYQQITEIAAGEGLTFHFDKAVPCNTVMAHQLLHLARKENVQLALEKRFFAAYFTEGKNLNNPEVLAAICREVGIDAQKALAVCNGDQYIRAINDDIREASGLGVAGVPFFLFDQSLAVKGAQSAAFLTDIMMQLKNK
ncbi:MAG: DsbA family oxidoreductase [Bacteroidales bacterium]